MSWTVADRYQIVRPLGDGGGGQVWLAHDLRTGAEVALKRVHVWTATQRARARREALALRSLRVPGVVTLRDEGEDDDGTFLVMDYIEGEPFPGATEPLPWPALVPLARRLLETLAAVHAAGIVHRDLKPQNVLVTPEGLPVILDFGVARGQPLGDTVTRSHHLVGTPRYLAPEALFSARVDGRADLYAVGIMLWEALTGSGPYAEDAPIGLKLHPPPPLLEAAPHVAPAAAAVIDALVHPTPERRPATASHVLRQLHTGESPGPELPLIGREEPLSLARARLSAGEGVRILAAPGAGATRFLEALEELLAPVPVAHPEPSNRPYGSLTPVLGVPDTSDLEQTRQILCERLADLDGLVFVDGADRLDRWSRRLLDDADSVVIVTSSRPCDVELQPLSPTDLRALFHGPERVLRLQSRAAELLWTRTQGLPALVAEEVRAWVLGGHATWEQGRLRLAHGALQGVHRDLAPATRRQPDAQIDPDLDDLLAMVWLAQPEATSARLRAATPGPAWECDALLQELEQLGLVSSGATGWIPRATSLQLQRWSSSELAARHAALAETHEGGTVERCRHLSLSGRTTEAAAEAPGLAERALADGRSSDALAVLATLMPWVDDAEERTEVLHAWADLALGQRAPGLVDRALRALQPHVSDLRVRAWWTLLRAREQIDAGAPARAQEVLAELRTLDGLPGSAAFARWQATLEMDAAKDDRAAATDVLHRYGDNAALRPRLDHWRGLMAYRDGRFDEAARLHEDNLALASGPLSRCSALYNAAAAWLADGSADRAEMLGRQLIDESRRAELHRFQARAEWIVRSVGYGRGDPLVPDLELVEAVGTLGVRAIATLVTLNEAAIAWRTGHPDAERLARCADEHATAAGQDAAGLLARSLVAVASADTELAQACLEAARGCPLPAITVQALGLAGPCLAIPPRGPALARAREVPRTDWARRREVLSIDEALSRIGCSAG